MQADHSEFERLKAILADRGWPELMAAPDGSPVLQIRKKGVVWQREPDIWVVRMALEMKEHLMLTQPETFFQNEHFRGYPAVFFRLSRIDDEFLADLIEEAWRGMAPPKVVAIYDQSHPLDEK